MRNKDRWKSGNRLDSVMNILLIVLALGVLGAGALEAQTGAAPVASSADHRA